MFSYSSIESHGIVTPEGERIKETRVNVANGKGTKTVIMKDNKGVHSDTIKLNSKEVKNIQHRKFMPELFHKSIKNIIRKKAKTSKRPSKKGTRKSKK